MKIEIICFCHWLKKTFSSSYYYDISKDIENIEELIELLGEQSLEDYSKEVLNFTSNMDDINYIMTKANLDWDWRIVKEGEKINKIKSWIKIDNSNISFC